MNAKLLSWFLGSGAPFDPASLQSKFAGWWKDERAGYIVDQLGTQERELLTQNSQAGQVFPGRAIQYNGTTKYNVFAGNQADLDIGNDPIVISCWVKVAAFSAHSTSPLIGKHTGTSVISGGFALATHNSPNGLRAFFYDSEGVLKTKDGSAISLNTWCHVVWGVDSDKKGFMYMDKVEQGTRPQLNGTFGACDTDIKWAFGAKFSPSTGATNGFKESQIRDVRILRNTNVTQAIVNSLYNGEVTGLETNWWMTGENNNSIIYDCVGGKHMNSVAFDGTEKVTGYWRQPYNDFGYAEDVTFGQIPPDMTSLVDGVPQDDVLGNPLVFKGRAKQNLIKDGSNVRIFDGAQSDYLTTLITATELTGLNTYFSGSTAQNIAVSALGTHGWNQFYSPSTGELIILKKDQYLTHSQESGLMSYLNATYSTNYHADTTAFLATRTGTYTDKEKARIDNVWRLFNRESIKTALETANLSALSEEDDLELDWIDDTFDAETASLGEVSKLLYTGLAPQKGNYKNNFNPSTATKYTQNSAHIMFKVARNFDMPFGVNRVYGCDDVANLRRSSCGFDWGSNNGSDYLRVLVNVNTGGTFGTYVRDDGFRNRTFVGTRTASNVIKIFDSDGELISGTTASVTRPNLEDYIGNSHLDTARYISTPNWMHAWGKGAGLNDRQARLYAAIVDGFCNSQLELAPEWIEGSVFRYKATDHLFVDRISDQVFWSDFKNVYYSTDGGATVTASKAFDSKILGFLHMVHIFDSGKIVFGVSKNKFYVTDTTLASIAELPMTKDGSPYTPHTPVSATYPGEYTKFLGIKKKMYLPSGNELLCFNTYNVSIRGACPAIVWYMEEDFSDIRVGYEFGQNPYITDNGAPNGGTGGNPVGDASVTEWVRHGHGLQQWPSNKLKFISMWGDFNRAALGAMPEGYKECQGWEHVYNESTHSFDSHTKIWESGQAERGKVTSCMILDEGDPLDPMIYFSSDTSNLAPASERGYFKVRRSLIGTLSNWTKFYDPEDADLNPMNMFHLDDNGFLMGNGYAATGTPSGGFFITTRIIFSPDVDDTEQFVEEFLKLPGDVYGVKTVRLPDQGGRKRYQIIFMPDYDYYLGAYSAIIEFNPGL